MGIAHYRLARYEEAIQCFESAVMDSTYATPGIAWYNMGLAYNKMQDYEKALDCFQKALDDKRSCPSPGLWNELAKVSDRLGQSVDTSKFLPTD
jgi:tetratricopeptide (TPR) repeat protein